MKKRAKLCSLLAELLNDTARFITETGADVYGAIRYISQKQKYGESDFPENLLRVLSDGVELQKAWRECSLNDGAISSLSYDEREIFISSCECFESATANEASQRLSKFAAYLSEAAGEEKKRAVKNGGAAAGLSFLGAAALFIILV